MIWPSADPAPLEPLATARARCLTTLGALGLALVLLALCGCQAPHAPSLVLPARPPSGGDTGYVYDELLAAPGLALDDQGKITGADRAWCKRALGRVLDLQQALDECQAERKALIR